MFCVQRMRFAHSSYRQMSAWLGRPHLIDQKDCSFTFPTLRLDESATEPHLLSPFAHIALQAQLARRIAQHKGDIQVIENLTADQVFSIEAECETFIEELPPVFRFASPDISLDEQHPYYVPQRRQLHVIIYMTMFDFLKPYLTRSPKNPKSSHDTDFRNMGIDLSLKLLKVARLLFDHEFPINARFHLVVFSVFDTATILCSAIIHDTDNVLPHREQVMDAIESALDMLYQLSLTRIGATSYTFLSKLIGASPVLSRWFFNRKRPRIDKPTTDSHKVETSQPGFATPAPQTTSTEMEPTLDIANDGISFDMDQFLAVPFGETPQLDIGGLEEIWDWDTLNLDAFLNHDPNYDLGM